MPIFYTYFTPSSSLLRKVNSYPILLWIPLKVPDQIVNLKKKKNEKDFRRSRNGSDHFRSLQFMCDLT